MTYVASCGAQQSAAACAPARKRRWYQVHFRVRPPLPRTEDLSERLREDIGLSPQSAKSTDSFAKWDVPGWWR